MKDALLHRQLNFGGNVQHHADEGQPHRKPVQDGLHEGFDLDLRLSGLPPDKLGYDVCAVNDGREAIETYKSQKNKINLVILDMQMPYDGEKTYIKLREINKKVKILLISGYTKDYKLASLLERGNCSFLNKPFNINSLKMNVSNMIK